MSGGSAAMYSARAHQKFPGKYLETVEEEEFEGEEEEEEEVSPQAPTASKRPVSSSATALSMVSTVK
jgi:hypothetical protein